MQTFQINYHSEGAPHYHIQSQAVKLEANGHENERRRQNDKVQKVANTSENFVLYGVFAFVYSAHENTGDVQQIVNHPACNTAQHTGQKDKYLHLFE